MNIGIHATLLIEGNYTGIAGSVNEILKIWAKDYPEHNFYLLTHKMISLNFDLPKNMNVIVKPWIINKGVFFDAFVLPKLMKEYQLDVFWDPAYYLPKSKNKCTKMYVSIPDLAFKRFDGITEKKNRIKLSLNAQDACERAYKIFAISFATKQDIVELFNIPEEKIIVSYIGGLPTDYQFAEKECIADNSKLIFDEGYFLYIGTIEPRKNIITIVKAFESYLEKTGNQEKLILAGKKGWNCDDVYEYIDKSKYSNFILLPGYISDNDKNYLLNHARIFLFPSLYEGFGIPILEAMAYHIPVITANNSALPEVAGNAGFYIDNATDEAALETTIERVMHLGVDEYKVLCKEMDEQVNKFSWKKNADEMMNVFIKDFNGMIGE